MKHKQMEQVWFPWPEKAGKTSPAFQTAHEVCRLLCMLEGQQGASAGLLLQRADSTKAAFEQLGSRPSLSPGQPAVRLACEDSNLTVVAGEAHSPAGLAV